MASRTPNLKFYVPQGASAAAGNFFVIDSLLMGSTNGRVNALPEDPLPGDNYILNSSKKIHVYTSRGWSLGLMPQIGMTVYDRDTGSEIRFNGTTWADVTDGGGGEGGGIAEAPSDAAYYARKDAGWEDITALLGAGGIADAPSDAAYYARRDAGWEDITGQLGGIVDAPADAAFYARKDNAWQDITDTLLADAPADAAVYARFNSTWTDITAALAAAVASIPDAPAGGGYYVRRDSLWEDIGGLIDTGIEEAPVDANVYARTGADWYDITALLGAQALAAAPDVDFVSLALANRHLLVYDAAISKWIPTSSPDLLAANLYGAAGNTADLRFYRGAPSVPGVAAQLRWAWRMNTTADSGSNVGSDMELSARDDAGASLWVPIRFIRSTGDTQVLRALTLASCTYDKPITIGSVRLWYSGGKLYWKNSAPANTTDGEVIGRGGASLPLGSAAGAVAGLDYYSGDMFADFSNAKLRWALRKDATAESGSNVGSDFQILARADDGSALFTVLKFIRSTGEIQVSTGGLYQVANAYDKPFRLAGTRFFIDASGFLRSKIGTPASAVDGKRVDAYAGALSASASTAIAPTDAGDGSVLRCTAATLVTVTLPNTLPSGWRQEFIQGAAGQVLIAGASGVVLRGFNGVVATAGIWDKLVVECIGNTDGVSAECLVTAASVELAVKRFGIAMDANGVAFSIQVPYPFTITDLKSLIATGGAAVTLAVYISSTPDSGGTVVTGLSACLADATATDFAATAANTGTAGQYIRFVPSSPSGAGMAYGMLNVLQTGAIV